MLHNGRNTTIGRFAIAGHAAAKPDSFGAESVDDLSVQQHVEGAAMHGVLRPSVSRFQSTGFGIDVVAVQAHQRPFLGGKADLIQVVLIDAEVVELTHGVGLQVDAHAQRPHLAHRLVYDATYSNLVQS
jgi:hypothetical protein